MALAQARPPDKLPPEVRAAAARGWWLLPVQPGGKTPLVKEWQKVATSDLRQLEALAAQFPGCNWGMETGKASGVVVIDVDGVEGRAVLAALEHQGFTLLSTLTVATGRPEGGEHRYYRKPVGVDIRNDQSGKIGPHIDVRGTGGFVVFPPSIHTSGKQYRFTDPDVTIAELPGWVVERLSARPSVLTSTAQASPQTVRKGSRTNSLVSLAGTMQRRGMSLAAIEAALLAENIAKCAPPLSEAKVRGIAADISKRYPAGENTTPENDFRLVGIGELLSRPQAPPDYLVEGLLITGTVSCVVSKPKVGKSTFARGLCLAVARGEPFLGYSSRQGLCIYLALEERNEEITADFRAMGANSTDPIEVHAAAAPASAIQSLVDLVRKRRPALVVIDPLFRLAYIRDEKAYAEVYAALGPLVDLARETGRHILVTHHAGKSPKSDPIDSPLGSTAIGGAAATTIVLNRRGALRTVQTVTRIGPVLSETVLTFDSKTRLLSVGGTRAESDCQEIEKEIVEILKAGGENSEPEIVDHVTGTNAVKRKALRSLVKSGVVKRRGTGKKGDPYKYSYAWTKYGARTSVQETETGPQPRANIDEKVVRGDRRDRPFQLEKGAAFKGDLSRTNPDSRPGDESRETEVRI